MMWDWIGSAWQYLIPFFVIIGFINAVLGLRARFKEWLPKKSVKVVRQLLLELENTAKTIQRYKKEPTLLIIDLIYDSTVYLTGLLIVIAISATLIYFSFISQKYTEAIPLLLFVGVVNSCYEIILFFGKVRKKIDLLTNPSNVIKEAKQLLEISERLQLVSDSEIPTLKQIVSESEQIVAVNLPS